MGETGHRYLQDYARLFALAGATAGDESTMTHLLGVAHQVLDTEMDLHREFASDYGISERELESTEKAPTCLAYTNFLVRTAYEGHEAEIAAALYPVCRASSTWPNTWPTWPTANTGTRPLSRCTPATTSARRRAGVERTSTAVASAIPASTTPWKTRSARARNSNTGSGRWPTRRRGGSYDDGRNILRTPSEPTNPDSPTGSGSRVSRTGTPLSNTGLSRNSGPARSTKTRSPSIWYRTTRSSTNSSARSATRSDRHRIWPPNDGLWSSSGP